jgi:MFS family permease
MDPESEAHMTRGAKRMMTMLGVVFAFSFAAMTLIATICQAATKEFGLKDFQTTLICVTVFPVAFAVFSLPMAWLAERFNRRWLITLSLALWGAGAIGAGLSQDFMQFTAARIVVAIALAGVTPAAHCIVSGYFRPGARDRAMGVFGMGMPAGGVAGALLSAWALQDGGSWRIACMAVGAAGLVAALLFRAVVRSGPPRPKSLSSEDLSGEEMTHPRRKPSVFHVIVALAITAFTGFAYAQYMLPMLRRNFELDYSTSAAIIGAMNTLGSLIGVYAGGQVGQVLARRDVRFQARLPAIACVLAAAAFAIGLMQTSLWVLVPFMFLGAAFHAMQFAPAFASLQDAAAPHRRAMTAAWALFFIGLLGLGLGPLALGGLSDAFAAANFDPPLMFHGLDFATACASRVLSGVESYCAAASASGLKQAMFILILPYLWAALHFSRAARTLREDTGVERAPAYELEEAATAR